MNSVCITISQATTGHSITQAELAGCVTASQLDLLCLKSSARQRAPLLDRETLNSNSNTETEITSVNAEKRGI